jgi:integrase
MSVWKDKAGRYHVAVQRGRKRIHRKCAPATTWRQAKDKEAEIRSRFDAVTSGTVLIADAIQHWLKTEVAHHRAKKATEGNAYALTDWIIGRTLSETVEVSEEYKQAWRGIVTNSTINRRLAVLRRVAHLAYKRWKWLDDPIWERIEMLPENPHREEFFTRSELAVMLRAIPQSNRRKAALVAAFTGIRRGQVAKLHPLQVQGDLIRLKTSKSGKPIAVPIVHHIRFALRRLPFGVHPDTLTHDVARAFPGKRFQDLRRTAGSLLLQAGVAIEVVSVILGHSDIRITKKIYAHLLVDNLRAGMAKLGRGNAPTLHPAKNEKAA